jgi:hypothetical protein
VEKKMARSRAKPLPFNHYPAITKELLLGQADSLTRLPVLLSLVPFCEPGEWYRLLGENWTMCDNIGTHWRQLVALFQFSNMTDIDQMMSDDERSARDELPVSFFAWRGCYAQNRDGLSYSLSRDVAARFPFRHRYRAKGQPLLLKARMRRSQVVVKLDRHE